MIKDYNDKMFLRNNKKKLLYFKTLKNLNLNTKNNNNNDFITTMNSIFSKLNTTYSKNNLINNSINNNNNKIDNEKKNKKFFFPKISENKIFNFSTIIKNKRNFHNNNNNNLKQSHSTKDLLSKDLLSTRRLLIQNFNKTNEKLFHKNFIRKKILTNNNNNNDSLIEIHDCSSKIKPIYIDNKIEFIKTHLQSFHNNNNNNFIINNKGIINLKNLIKTKKDDFFFHTKLVDNKDGSICFVYDKNYNENDYKLKNDMNKFKEKNKSIDNFIKKYEIKEKNNIKKRSLSKEEIKKINKSVFEDKNIFKKLLKIIKN